MRKKWTQSEDDYIRKNISTTTQAEMAEKLGRTVHAVRNRISILNLSNGRWTNEDIEYLKESWGNKSVSAIASRLNRTEDAVIVKVFKL